MDKGCLTGLIIYTIIKSGLTDIVKIKKRPNLMTGHISIKIKTPLDLDIQSSPCL